MATVAYLQERQTEFPGVTVEQVFQRFYPQKQIGAHLVGYVAQVSEEALKEKLYTGVKQGDRVGVAGIESSYDRYLRGRNGASRVQVDALGNPRGELTTREPMPGRQLRLTLDLDVQKAGQDALGGAKGAFVVMDVKTGAIRALGSTPVVQPERLLQADPPVRLQAPDRPGQRRAAVQPGDAGPVSDRLGVQADHVGGRARERTDHAR